MDQMERIATARRIWEQTSMSSPIYEDVAELYADLLYNAPTPTEFYKAEILSEHFSRTGILTHRFCGRCKAVVNKGAKYCDQCGRELLGNK